MILKTCGLLILLAACAPSHDTIGRSGLSSVAEQEYRPLNANLTAGLCVERLVNNGYMNLVKSRVIVRDPERPEYVIYEFNFAGGHSACAYFAREEFGVEIEARSYDRDANDPNVCTSTPMRIDLVKGVTSHIVVEPQVKGSTYLCGWTLTRQ